MQVTSAPWDSAAPASRATATWLFRLRPPAQLPPRMRGLQLARPRHVARNSRVRRGWQHVHAAAACAKRGERDVPCQRVKAAAHDEVLLLQRLEDCRPADATHGRQRGALQRAVWRRGKRRQHSTVLRGRCGSGCPRARLQPRMHSFGSRFAQRITRCEAQKAWTHRRRALQPKHTHKQGCKENKKNNQRLQTHARACVPAALRARLGDTVADGTRVATTHLRRARQGRIAEHITKRRARNKPTTAETRAQRVRASYTRVQSASVSSGASGSCGSRCVHKKPCASFSVRLPMTHKLRTLSLRPSAGGE